MVGRAATTSEEGLILVNKLNRPNPPSWGSRDGKIGQKVAMSVKGRACESHGKPSCGDVGFDDVQSHRFDAAIRQLKAVHDKDHHWRPRARCEHARGCHWRP
jgi:hypothetical protein